MKKKVAKTIFTITGNMVSLNYVGLRDYLLENPQQHEDDVIQKFIQINHKILERFTEYRYVMSLKAMSIMDVINLRKFFCNFNTQLTEAFPDTHVLKEITFTECSGNACFILNFAKCLGCKVVDKIVFVK